MMQPPPPPAPEMALEKLTDDLTKWERVEALRFTISINNSDIVTINRILVLEKGGTYPMRMKHAGNLRCDA
eukprot:2318729-Prorocentrum_lima.AAC.1